jgi:isopenicillin N synthase-like dioxygenase
MVKKVKKSSASRKFEEQAELFRRGYLLASPHRVLADTNDRGVDRISVPLFYNPAPSSNILIFGPIGSMGTITRIRMKSNRMLLLVGENTCKSLSRPHPDVFPRHHPHLTLLPDGQMIIQQR